MAGVEVHTLIDGGQPAEQTAHALAEFFAPAKESLEIAVYDLWAQLYGAPLYKMLGGGDPVITTDITISVEIGRAHV